MLRSRCHSLLAAAAPRWGGAAVCALGAFARCTADAAGARRAASGGAAPAGPTPPVLVEEGGDHAVVTLNRPGALNALSSEVIDLGCDLARSNSSNQFSTSGLPFQNVLRLSYTSCKSMHTLTHLCSQTTGPQVGAALLEALRRLDATPAVRAIVITGAGKAFAAGADIMELSKLTSPDEVRLNRQRENQKGGEACAYSTCRCGKHIQLQ